MQFLLVDEKDKPQQSDSGAIIFGHGITRALICIFFFFFFFLQRVALGVSTTACGLSSRVFYVPGRD